jgi:DNA gyrase B
VRCADRWPIPAGAWLHFSTTHLPLSCCANEKCTPGNHVCYVSEAKYTGLCCIQVSFCNAICTSNGGKHVDYVTDQISKCAFTA